MPGRLTAILATRHEIFLVDPFPTILPNDALTSATRQKRFGVIWGLELSQLGAAEVPNTDFDTFGGRRFLSDAGTVGDIFGGRRFLSNAGTVGDNSGSGC